MQISWSPASWMASISQSTHASTSLSRGLPVEAGCQPIPENLSPPLAAKTRQTSSWSSARTFTQNMPASRMVGQLLELLLAPKPTRGGSSETEKKEPTARPAGPSPPMAVTTVTPVGKWPRTVRKWAASMPPEESSMGSGTSEIEAHALGCRQDLVDPAPLRHPPGVLQEPVHEVVAVARVVVEQRQPAGARLPGHLHGEVHAAVAPVGLLLPLLRRVLRVVDEEVDAVAQLEHGVGHPLAAVEGDLVVTDVGHRHAGPVDPVAVVLPHVGHRADPHLGVAHGHVGLGQVVEDDLAPEVGGPHGEVGRPHDLLEGGGQVDPGLAGPDDVEPGAGPVDRREEGQSLDVVPVEV